MIPWLTLRGMRADVPARSGMDPHSSANPPQTMEAAAHRGRCLRGHGHCRPGMAVFTGAGAPARSAVAPDPGATPMVFLGPVANAGSTEQAFTGRGSGKS